MKIEITGVSKKFGKKEVLKNLSFTAGSGQFIGILGENGSGKSTFFSIVTGLLKGNGTFLCDGIDLLRDSKTRAKRVGFVPQSPPLIGELTAKDNLKLWYSKKDMLHSLECGFLKLLGIDEFLNTPVSKMSGGMKKRLAIGCAISHNPDILFLDEPCSALDLPCKERIYAYLREFTAGGGIVVMATHDIYELVLCHDVYVLRDGALKLYSGSRDIKSLVEQMNHA
ncbi:MAG: ABC transporter ATP-binding protein [Clostridia bacterium]|nr:ABC transporter ATP-binding protein [Clostridia bacterium]